MDIVFEEESMRDGLQFEKRIFSLEEKRMLFRKLTDAGVRRIHIGSFVNPGRVPQMADTGELVAQILKEAPDAEIKGLVLNERGLERAVKSGLKRVCMSASVSDTQSRSNTNTPPRTAIRTMTRLIAETAGAGLWTQGQIQCVFGCAHQCETPEDEIVETAKGFADAGAHEISLADTTGMANPVLVRRIVSKVKRAVGGLPISLHLHDTRGLGLVNMMAGYDAGVRIFDASAGGLGGCPFIRGASGNIATEDAVHLFQQLGMETEIDLNAICEVVNTYEGLLGRQLPGHMSRVVRNQDGVITA